MKKKLGKYEILGVLGRGSMGVVYKGLDPEINKLVAIKTMNQKVVEQPDMQERFHREGTILGQLNHKNIISVYSVGEDDEIIYIAMEYLEGTSLERLLQRKKKLGLRRSMEIVIQVCDGVGAAHRQNIIHRDIKPANVFLLEGDHVKVLDFGVAHFQNSQLTNSGVLLGTINYMAPEQITGIKVDHRADIFSIGVILYELLTLKNPFLGKNISQTMVKLVNTKPDPIANIPKKMQDLVNRILSKNRDDRFYSCREVARAIQDVMRDPEFEKAEKVFDGPGGSFGLRSFRGGNSGAPPAASPTAAPPAAGAAPGSPQRRSTQNQILQKMIAERVDGVREHIKNERIEDAEALIAQLKRLDRSHPAVDELTNQLKKARRSKEEKRNFMDQLTHETLAKANEAMADRHYVSAIELCQKVLRRQPDNQDARVIKATSLSKMKRFIDQVETEKL
jgi:serine/threonine protein kinase